MDLPKRKPNRIPGYNYSTPGAYFLTICTAGGKCIFWERVGATIGRPQKPPLSQYGRIVDEAIREIPLHYPAVSVDHYIVMPNHIHLLLQIHTDKDGRPTVTPTASRIVQQLKGAITKRIGHSVWQKLFHDYVIRGEQDYLKIWTYIENNPAKWNEDCFFVE